MFINIILENTEISTYKFPVSIYDLEEAINVCYLGQGTSFMPIPVDDFMTNEYKFPRIGGNTFIKVNLEPEESEKNYVEYDPQIVCGKIIDVGKAFNDIGYLPQNHWNKIFDCDNGSTMSSPDGTLYISPDDNNYCHLATKGGDFEAYISYSILFSALIQHAEERKRYYFIIDPLIKVSSGVG